MKFTGRQFLHLSFWRYGPSSSEYFSRPFKSLSYLDDDQGKLLIIAAYSASLSPLVHSLVDLDPRTSGILALFFFLLSMVWNELGRGKDIIASDRVVRLNAGSHKFVKIGLALSGILII